MDDFVIYTTTGRREEISSADSMKRMLYYPSVDMMLSEMKPRLSPQNEAVMIYHTGGQMNIRFINHK
jgi:hypothetical protein